MSAGCTRLAVISLQGVMVMLVAVICSCPCFPDPIAIVSVSREVTAAHHLALSWPSPALCLALSR